MAKMTMEVDLDLLRDLWFDNNEEAATKPQLAEVIKEQVLLCLQFFAGGDEFLDLYYGGEIIGTLEVE